MRFNPPVDNVVSIRMKRVRQRDTVPELVVRKLLFSKGYRYRLCRKDLPGSPDIVFPSRRKVIFVHGCFWHGHQGCSRATLPNTRATYWQNKILKNKNRDACAISSLRQLGWCIHVVWECETKNPIELEMQLRFFLESKM